MGMDNEFKLNERFPWLKAIEEIARQQGFFHWELQFSRVFHKGGFDLQVGNPPWVQARWEEASVLAELEPWFKLVDKPAAEMWRERKRRVLEVASDRHYFVSELAALNGVAAYLGSVANYELLKGAVPNLYRAFMIRVWLNLDIEGTSGLIHPDSHLNGVREKSLRAASYRHLRMHAHFQNRRLLFSEIDWNIEYGIQIYGAERSIGFTHVSWLYDVEPLLGSFEHDGTGERPGIKHKGYWDLRPHRERLTWVNEENLAQWGRLTGEIDIPPSEVKLLYPVTNAERRVISALSEVQHRLGKLDPQISSGYDETGDKKSGIIEWKLGYPKDWSEVIVRGPQFSAATPFAKQPPKMGRNDPQVDLRTLSPTAVPSTDYQNATDRSSYERMQDVWLDRRQLAELRSSSEIVGQIRQQLAMARKVPLDKINQNDIEEQLAKKATRRYTSFYRMFWRSMIANNTERSIYAALMPPGPAHIDGVNSMALANNRQTALVAACWSSLPFDYLMRITGRTHLRASEARSFPAPLLDFPLNEELLLRVLRLNSLTEAYADLWADLYRSDWQVDAWAVNSSSLGALGEVPPFWNPNTPLRREAARRMAFVEIDVLIALMLGIGVNELTALYHSRFPQLSTYESAMWFDAKGRRIAENYNAYGHGQGKEHYGRLMDYLAGDNPLSLPEGYEAPFYKADREAEYRRAHAVFSERLERAKAEGWTPEGGSSSA
jgi:hypothetical protein